MDRTWSSVAPARAENDGERGEAAQDQAVAVRPGERVTVDGEPQARVAVQQLFESNPGFEPGQGRAEAVVDAVAEPEVRPVAAADVEYVGHREPARIAVSRAQAHQHLLVRGDLDAVEGHRLGRHPERGMRDRGGEADELVDRGG